MTGHPAAARGPARRILPRSGLRALAHSTHGGAQADRDDGVEVRADFSTGVNAYGPAPELEAAVRMADPRPYPDPESRLSRAAVATAIDRPTAEVALGAGTVELLQAVCLAFIRPNDVVLVPRLAFGEYRRAALVGGARVRAIRGKASEPMDVGAFCRAVQLSSPRLAFLCTPENPSGARLNRDQVARAAAACARAGALLVLDQAYDGFDACPLGTPALPGQTGVLHLRSLTKEHALAGVRVGLAVGPARLIEAVERVRMPWTVSRAAQAAATVAFTPEVQGHVRHTTTALRRDAAALAEGCRAMGIATLPSSTHYFLARIGDAPRVCNRLLHEYGLKLRDATSFGLRAWVRIAAQLPTDNALLLPALAACAATPEL